MKTDKEMPNMVEIESNLMADATGLEWRGPYCLQLMLERLPDLKKKRMKKLGLFPTIYLSTRDPGTQKSGQLAL